ncbi:Hypothetical predicted protein [Cloeon dipterum]|uniref:C2H2-type domain-containing protein n=1 Tax=Cloeon dipterum TaxID=197152 RepID=A0A8S1E247_9INSE|nr:Hypothetical predicted protein [Cloeon dipterum]
MANCTASFYHYGDLMKHMRMYHDFSLNVDKLECVFCEKKYMSKDNLRMHLENHLKRFDCIRCGVTLHSEEKLIAHLASHYNKCEMCNKDFDSKAELLQHDATVHEPTEVVTKESRVDPKDACKIHTCSRCDAIFVNKFYLDEHIKSQHAISLILTNQCDVCSKQVHVRFMWSHQMSHTKKASEHQCCWCPCKYTDLDELSKHLSQMHNAIPFACTKCSATFLTALKLRQHKIKEHGQPAQFVLTE